MMWSNVLICVVVMLGCAHMCNGQSFFFGKCPRQSVVQGFETSRYLGKWFENQKYPAFFEFGGKCITATYTDKTNGKIGVINEQISIFTGDEKTIVGEAELVSNNGEAKLQVTFGGSLFGGTGSSNGNYWVLDTDYTSYTIVWSCSDLLFANFQILWILTRERVPSDAVIKTARDKIRERGLDLSKLQKTDQSNCP